MSPLLLLSCLIASLWLSAEASAFTTANIPAGTIKGAKCASSDATSFLSIPFAQPPVGELRFAPPQPHGKKFTDSTLNATTPAPSCIQFGTEFLEEGKTSEDCLFLDVWVPPNTTATSGLPVKVWIYGGSNTAGGISEPLYDGCNIADAGTILVSINYRLGALGFLALESAGIGGNFGIQDILLGLQWVQDRIAAFGGDPEKVLLFGQSAGAANVFTIATLPQAPSLFKAAICESGGGRDAPLKATANAMGTSYAQALGCGTSDISCFRSKSPAALNASLPTVSTLGVGTQLTGSSFYVDGTVIPAQPSEVGVKVPTVFGFNSHDGALFILSAFSSPSTPTPSTYTTFLLTNFGPSAAALIAAQYPLSAFNNTPYPAFYAMDAVYTDYSYKCPAYRGLKRAVTNGVPAWGYRFAHMPSCAWLPGVPDEAVGVLGATHTAELPFVFGNLEGLGGGGNCSLGAGEREISKHLLGAWTSMAENGDPSRGGLEWPVWTVEGSRALVVGNETAVGAIYFEVCEFWERIYEEELRGAEAAGGNVTTGGGTANGSVPSGGSLSPTAGTAAFTGGAASAVVRSSLLYGLVLAAIALVWFE